MTESQARACKTIQEFLTKYDTDQPAEILADILHYCQVKGIDFNIQLELANVYVEEELAVDEVLSRD